MRRAFTLIEVMVAVIIITVVIAGLLQLFANNTRFFDKLDQKVDLSTQATLLLGAGAVGFEKDEIKLDELTKDFDLDDELRRKLKEMKAEVDYHTVMQMDESSLSEEEQDTVDELDTEGQSAAAATLEIGRTSLMIGDERTSFLRLKLQ